MNIYTHKHHIIPRHVGGSDDPSNLIELTAEDHAIAHRHLWKMYGRKEDKIAWLALSGQITISEASRQAFIIGSYKGGYAKKPNKVPAHNKSYFHCIGCRKPDKPSNILKGHILCFQRFYNLPPSPNSSRYNQEKGTMMAKQNNSQSKCPKCGKIGQYRALKRWHFDKCHFTERTKSSSSTPVTVSKDL